MPKLTRNKNSFKSTNFDIFMKRKETKKNSETIPFLEKKLFVCFSVESCHSIFWKVWLESFWSCQKFDPILFASLSETLARTWLVTLVGCIDYRVKLCASLLGASLLHIEWPRLPLSIDEGRHSTAVVFALRTQLSRVRIWLLENDPQKALQKTCCSKIVKCLH